jgi:hypothetical protein
MSLAADYRRDGYALCRGLVDAVTLQRLHRETDALVGGSRHAPHDYRDIVMVCGDDPFAESGIEDLARPFLRSPAAP